MGAFDLQQIKDHCAALQKALPLSIKNEAQYEQVIEMLNQLLDAGGADESHPLALAVRQLGEVIALYEALHHPLPELPPNELLRYLMAERGMRQSDLTELGSQGVVSEILSGRRQLNARQIAALARRFELPESVFFYSKFR